MVLLSLTQLANSVRFAYNNISIVSTKEATFLPHTLISRNPARSSNPLYGLAPPPSLSILPAQTLHFMGLKRSAPPTRPKHTRTVDTTVSTRISSGKEEGSEGWC